MIIKVTPSMENYLESIFELGQDGQVVRVKDLAAKLNVRMASVTGALRNLAKSNLVYYAPYKNIVLTEKGENMARRIHSRHHVITSFLIDALGVMPAVAEEDACKLEHVLSRETMDGLLKFMLKHKFISVSEKDLFEHLEEEG